jgi:hypothetical protein
MSNYLPTDYQSFIATSRYARWLNDENRRENWRETVERFIANVVKARLIHVQRMTYLLCYA